jgi:uncharacterized protein YdhG (YjbR/CyaY superfamily)
MKSDATTVEQYLSELPNDRRAAIETVRETILTHLPNGYVETMNWGMIVYEVPLAVHPETYNGQPLLYAGLASQKNHLAVYLSALYMDVPTNESFRAAYAASGKRMDVGKNCVRFKRVDDLPLDAIGDVVASHTVEEFSDLHKQVRRRTR